MTANASAPKRPMLEQGKTWYYVYHHFTDRETAGPDGNLYEETAWLVYYYLSGDTIIDGRQYMKMYREDEMNFNKKYFGAFREDEEGRVYFVNYNSDKDYKIFDLSMDFDYEIHPDTTIIETIKANGQYFHRYQYYNIGLNGDFYNQTTAVEGVGYSGFGIAHYLFDPQPDCICDYESLNYVSGRDFWFDASDFNAPKEIELAEGEQELINSNNDFAFNLFREARRDTSCVLSPLSITYALGMLNNGADGQTLQEINQTLGFGEAGADAINAFCQKMLKEANTLDPKTKALLANTIFVNEGQGYRLQNGFIDKANEFYEAQPQNRDFNDGETMDVINQWASDHTMGMIPKVLDEQTFDPTSINYLLNALYFKGTWSNPFRKEMTQDEPFGGGPNVPMMHKQNADFQYAENDIYQAIKLPYGNGAYLMTVILPREDKTIGDVLSQMDGKNWRFKDGSPDVDLKLPRFEIDTNLDLIPIMSALGMHTAFSHNDADFSEFCNIRTYIGLMKQVARIKVNEEGTEAAAITIIGMEAAGIPHYSTFHANRPFLYIISEQSSGCIFFIGQYMGESTRSTDHIENPTITTDNPMIYDLQGRKMVNGQLKKGLYIVDGKKVVIK